jgi:molybdopterin synthase catalytic subunit
VVCVNARAVPRTIPCYTTPVRVTLLYFAACRERAGRSSEAVELPDGSTAADALAAACRAHPELAPVAGKLRLAVDQEFAPPEQPLRDGAELALIPPVSGGAGTRP